MSDELSKLLKKAYTLDRQEEKAAAEIAAGRPAKKKKGKTAAKADGKKPRKPQTTETPENGG